MIPRININQNIYETGFKISDAILLKTVIKNFSNHSFDDYFFIPGNHDDNILLENLYPGYNYTWDYLMGSRNYVVSFGNVNIVMDGLINGKYNDTWLLETVESLDGNILVCRHHNVFPTMDNVVGCIYGHTHYKHDKVDKRYTVNKGVVYLDVSGIDFCHAGDSSHSYLFSFINESNMVVVRDFNHSSNRWMENTTIVYLLYPFSGDSVNMVFCSDLHINAINCGLMFNYDWVGRCLSDMERFFPSWKYCFVLGDICDTENRYWYI